MTVLQLSNEPLVTKIILPVCQTHIGLKNVLKNKERKKETAATATIMKETVFFIKQQKVYNVYVTRYEFTDH